MTVLFTSVPDLQVFEPPGSVIQRYGFSSETGSYHPQAKIVKEPLISTILLLL
jgi:hypothetical protein